MGIWHPAKVKPPIIGAGTLTLQAEAKKLGLLLPGGGDGFREPHHSPPTLIGRSLRLFAGV